MGKSWLMNELARTLSVDAEPEYLVGFAEPFGQNPDLFLQATVDLYQRWLGNANYAKQAQLLWKKKKQDFVTNTGIVFGNILANISKLGGPIAEPIACIVNDAFKAMASANQLLQTGDVTIPLIGYEQALELATLVSELSDKPIVIFLDQWEESPALEASATLLKGFLRHIEDWPQCHIFIALRKEGRAYEIVDDLENSLPGTMEVYDLMPMHLSTDSEQSRLITYINDIVPITRNVAKDELLALIDGYPGVIYHWKQPYQAKNMQTCDDLRAIAADAMMYRFREFEYLLPGLTKEQRICTIRLAIIPLPLNHEAWKFVSDIVLYNLPVDELDEIKRNGILEAIDPPTFGHSKRRDAVESWIAENWKTGLKRECDFVISEISTFIRPKPSELGIVFGDDLSKEMFAAIVLTSLLEKALTWSLPNKAQALCASASSMFSDAANRPNDPQMYFGIASLIKSKTAPLISMGIYNAINEALKSNDTTISDRLIDELSDIAQTYSSDSMVTQRFARSLMNALYYGSQRDIDGYLTILNRLSEFAKTNSNDQIIVSRYGYGVLNTLNRLIEQGATEEMERGLLDDLRQLIVDHPENDNLRDAYTGCLFSMLKMHLDGKQFNSANAYLKCLREQYCNFPGDERIRGTLARGLFNVHNVEGVEQDHANVFLDELRSLYSANPQCNEVAEYFAGALANSIEPSKMKSDQMEWAMERLDELRGVLEVHADMPTVEYRMAAGIVNMLSYTIIAEATQQRDELIQELEGLVSKASTDSELRDPVSFGLMKIVQDAAERHEIERGMHFINELEMLYQTAPKDDNAMGYYAFALYKLAVSTEATQDALARETLLDGLRNLISKYPDARLLKDIAEKIGL
jgi:hypothetical protein